MTKTISKINPVDFVNGDFDSLFSRSRLSVEKFYAKQKSAFPLLLHSRHKKIDSSLRSLGSLVDIFSFLRFISSDSDLPVEIIEMIQAKDPGIESILYDPQWLLAIDALDIQVFIAAINYYDQDLDGLPSQVFEIYHYATHSEGMLYRACTRLVVNVQGGFFNIEPFQSCTYIRFELDTCGVTFDVSIRKGLLYEVPFTTPIFLKSRFCAIASLIYNSLTLAAPYVPHISDNLNEIVSRSLVVLDPDSYFLTDAFFAPKENARNLFQTLVFNFISSPVFATTTIYEIDDIVEEVFSYGKIPSFYGYVAFQLGVKPTRSFMNFAFSLWKEIITSFSFETQNVDFVFLRKLLHDYVNILKLFHPISIYFGSLRELNDVLKEISLAVINLFSYEGTYPSSEWSYLRTWISTVKWFFSLSSVFSLSTFRRLFFDYFQSLFKSGWSLGSLSPQASWLVDAKSTFDEIASKDPSKFDFLDWNTIKSIHVLHDSLLLLFNLIKHPNREIDSEFIQDLRSIFKDVPIPYLELVLPIDTNTIRTWGQLQDHCIGTYADNVFNQKSVIIGFWNTETDHWFGHAMFDKEPSNTWWSLSQFRGYHNSSLPSDIYNQLVAWMSKCLKDYEELKKMKAEENK